MSGFATFFWSIDGHDLEIIEVDGVCIFFFMYKRRTRLNYLPTFFLLIMIA